MQHIETVTVGSGGASSVTFSAIPDTFTDLYVVVSARASTTGDVYHNMRVTFNSSSSGYSERLLFGLGSSTGSASDNQGYLRFFYATRASATSNTFANSSLYVPNYRSSVAKSVSYDSVTENNATAGLQGISGGIWTGTDPITALTIITGTGTFVEHSSFSLYGITAGSDGVVTVS